MAMKCWFLLVLSLMFIVSCDSDLKTANENRDEFKTIDIVEKIYFGAVPKRFISYSESKDGVWQGSIAFNSNDIPSYSGGEFSVKVFLKYFSTKKAMNNPEKHFLETVLSDGRWVRGKHVHKVEIGEAGDFIGKNNLVITKYNPTNSKIPIREHILMNGKNSSIFHHKYLSDKERNFYGVAEYETSIKCLISAIYQIKYHPKDEFTHEKFIYAKRFLEDFY